MTDGYEKLDQNISGLLLHRSSAHGVNKVKCAATNAAPGEQFEWGQYLA